MLTVYLLLAFIVSVITSIVGLPWLLRLAKRRGLYDMPNKRKVHHNKIPRIGGMIFFPSVMMASLAVMLLEVIQKDGPQTVKVTTLIILSGVVMIYLIGVIDDILGLNARFKFMIQFIAAAMMPFCDLYIDNMSGLFGVYGLPIYIAWPLTVFVTLLLVNSMNLIDGIDGLSSSLALIALIVFIPSFLGVRSTACAILAISLAASLIVFMYFNLYGNELKGTKTFMGDAGSLILGYTMAFLVIKYSTNTAAQAIWNIEPVVMSFTLVLIPIFDLVRVAFTRLFQRKSIFAADKQHLHHLCLDAGMSMRGTLRFIISLQLLFCVINLIIFYLHINVNILVLTDILIFALVTYILSHRRKPQPAPIAPPDPIPPST
ncbi:MAG: undecaprenyl/decaprenyl-phosphate alpha-N-acetylglucosaminyl 1-phosphate transferase, partial [Bacteroidaceae bacterium]|nr:undecaprenyl/decaprenyl-phosphate alpha-N-acetylglucosaminyl 1-phosphate transferase [Bacteroidaceae bacterium]